MTYERRDLERGVVLVGPNVFKYTNVGFSEDNKAS